MVGRVLGALLVGLAGAAWANPAEAQVAAMPTVPGSEAETGKGFFAAPGNYGMSFGTPSYGSVRTYSSFSSPYGGGYAYGYSPYALLPGRYGAGLWQPGVAQGPLDNVGAHSYRTFPVPYTRGTTAVTPPVGFYAPAFGPPVIPGQR